MRSHLNMSITSWDKPRLRPRTIPSRRTTRKSNQLQSNDPKFIDTLLFEHGRAGRQGHGGDQAWCLTSAMNLSVESAKTVGQNTAATGRKIHKKMGGPCDPGDVWWLI